MVSTPAYGTVHLSHRVPATGFPFANDAGGGGVEVAWVEYPTVSATPSVFPQLSAVIAPSGTNVVFRGTASVMTKVNAEPEE